MRKASELIGIKWGELAKEEREELLSSCNTVDGRTGNDTNGGGDCIVDFENGLSVSGRIISNDEEDVIEIDDNAKIYCPFE